MPAFALPLSGQTSTDIPALIPGAPVERELAAGARHVYRLDAPAGRHLLVTVEQRGIDVLLSTLGGSAVEMNTAGSRWGAESLLLTAGAEPILIAISPAVAVAPPGRYEVRVEELDDASPEERGRIEAEGLLTESGRLQRQGTAEAMNRAADRAAEALPIWLRLGRNRERARTLYLLAVLDFRLGKSKEAEALCQQSLGLWEELRDPLAKADALALMGLAAWARGNDADALERSQAALEIFRERSERWGEAVTRNNVCLVRHSRGEWRQAIPCYEEALRLLRETGDPGAETSALINLGGVYDLLGEPQRALDAYGQALARAVSAGDRGREAQTLNNLAVVYTGLGETEKALADSVRSLALFREIGDRRGEARTLSNLGAMYRQRGEPQRSIGSLEEGLALRRELGDRRGEAATLNNLGRAREDLGDAGKAWELYGQALSIGRSLGDRRTQASSLQRMGEAEVKRGRAPEALSRLLEALEIRRALEDRPGQAETLTALARVERGLGQSGQARAHVEEVLSLIESTRARVLDPDLRSTYLGTQQRAFELAIDLERELDAGAPGKGHAEIALALAERARARTLLELLLEARTDFRRGVDPALREREQDVSHRLSAAAARQVELLAGSPSEEQKEAASRRLRELLAEADRIAGEVRRTSPRYAALTQPQPLDGAGIRRLLDPGTLLLEYWLGEERSFLWAVTSGSVDLFELPRRAVVEALARRVYEGLRIVEVGSGAEATEEAEALELSRMVLGPVAARLAGQRLAIVADGALQYIPFAALQDPAGPGFLIERHEIVSLPSASVLAVGRGVPAVPRPAPLTLAVLADPVFSAEDPRVRSRSGERGGSGLSRLPATRREAEAIAGLLPPDQVKMSLGFEVRRGAVVGGDLGRYRILHFATHGVIDAATPRLSGLVLSLVDEEGRPQDGFLSLGDVYNLDLSADLVVLSGCETALGREIRGEGLVGLVRGFLYAGAQRVVASLWRVQDRATAELMTQFYRAMLLEGKPSAAALREAQLSILRKRRWRQPYSWAGFVLQGDWR